MHADPTLEYPTYWGFENEIGIGKGIGFNKNYPIKNSMNFEKYSLALKDALELIDNFSPDVLIIPFGGDTYKDDPVHSPLYTSNLDLEDYISIGKIIKNASKNLKIIVL